jgi:hypothetical protein
MLTEMSLEEGLSMLAGRKGREKVRKSIRNSNGFILEVG